MKIVVPEKVSPRGIAELKSQPGWQVVELPPSSAQDGSLARELADADALIVRSAIKVTAPLLAQAPKLKVVGRAGVGVDNVDLDAATRKGVVVMNTPGGNAVSVAELALGMMIALARQLPRADATTRAGQWEKKSLQGAELMGKTLGIIGLGKVGAELAKRAHAFGMELVAYDPFISPLAAKESAATLLPLEEVLATADFLSLHVTLTPETRGMFNDRAFARMKNGARLVNCARGELIDENALYSALKSGKLAGAALDVFQKEPPGGSELLSLPNLIATPHIAASTQEAQERVGFRIAELVRDYLLTGTIHSSVNVPSVTIEEQKALQPWIELGQKMGAMLGQLVQGKPRDLLLRFAGDVEGLNLELISNAVVAGVLNQILAEAVNLVNARAMAEKGGLTLHVTQDAYTRGSVRSLTARITTDAQDLRIQGAVLHGTIPRLMGLDENLTIEAPLEGNLVVLRNDDVPGVIGHVGAVLGRRGINIASFTLGRQQPSSANGAPGGQPLAAVALVQTDAPVPQHVIEDIRQHPAIHYARAVQL